MIATRFYQTMNFKNAAARLINFPLGLAGLEMRAKTAVPSRRKPGMPGCTERLRHAAGIGFKPGVIFDAGAFKGTWTIETAAIFPRAQFVVFEPNPSLQTVLKTNLAAIQPPPIFVEAALGQTQGSAQFNIWGDPDSAVGASLLGHVQGQAENAVMVKVETLDAVSARLNLRPGLVKLDLQGAELLALRGGRSVLSDAEIVVVEFGCLDAYSGRATPRELLDLLYEHDFTLYDIVDLHYRPYDGALTGGDFFFVKNSSPLRSYKDWK